MVFTYFLEIAGMFFLPLLCVLLAIFLGQQLGKYFVRKSPGLPVTAIGSVVSAILGLFTFMLAFTFQIASNHYDARRALILKEVSDIRTVYLRSQLLREPHRTSIRTQLTEYVDIWVDLTKDPSRIHISIDRSKEILNNLWDDVREIPEQERCNLEYSLYSSSVTSLVESFSNRITLFVETRIPFAVLLLLYLGSFLSMMTLGYQFGISGKGGFRISLVLAIIFSFVIFLIIALDHPETRLVKISQKPLMTLQHQLHDKQP